MENLKKVVKILDDKHAADIVVLDMKNYSPIYDYMIITTAKNDRLAAGIVKEIKDVAEELGLNLKRVEGTQHYQWVLADLSQIVIHVFTEETRLEYNLEKLWRDVPRVDAEELLK
ncbi:MAG TPA: ribosome silencing factor [Firmicutes bacterium]|nr:ribosome silencing factor [Bacillota bacterium]